MAIQLDHIIVPARDKVEAARRLAALLDVPWDKAQGEFAPVYVNDGLTLDFAERPEFEGHHHICFRVSDSEFDAIFQRLQAAGIPYRSRPHGDNDGTINTRLGGKNLYWEADGHLWEMLTVSYARREG